MQYAPNVSEVSISTRAPGTEASGAGAGTRLLLVTSMSVKLSASLPSPSPWVSRIGPTFVCAAVAAGTAVPKTVSTRELVTVTQAFVVPER